jgi:hypothetical protein
MGPLPSNTLSFSILNAIYYLGNFSTGTFGGGACGRESWDYLPLFANDRSCGCPHMLSAEE